VLLVTLYLKRMSNKSAPLDIVNHVAELCHDTL
jgi:hypothetical protein